jgi:lysophospholipase L1-like esterase
VFSNNPKFGKKSTISYKVLEIMTSDAKPQDAGGVVLQKLRNERKNGKNMKEIPDLKMPLKDYESNLYRIINISLENGAKVLFVTQPYLWDVNNTEEEDSMMWMTTDYFGSYYYVKDMAETMDKYNQILLNVCLNNSDVFCLDLSEKVPKSLNYFYDDVHFNERGAQLVAEEISFFMTENFDEFNLLCYNK